MSFVWSVVCVALKHILENAPNQLNKTQKKSLLHSFEVYHCHCSWSP